MPSFSPFRAFRYTRRAGDHGDLLAPPYDVIDPERARELRSRSPFNAVRLVLPEGEPPDRHRRAAERLEEWIGRGALAEDEAPGLYVYAQRFRVGDEPRERRGLFGALELTPFREGEVIPHEETHRGPKEDRLALTEACRTQLSPVFLVARDAGGALLEAFESVVESAPEVETRTPDGIGHRLWKVSGREAARRLAAAVGAEPLLVADGHHRYETALEMERLHPEIEGASRVLACVVSSRDPGLATYETHRALRGGFPGEGEGVRAPGARTDRTERLSRHFRVSPLGSSDPEEAAAAAREAGGGAMTLLAGGEAWRLEPREEALREAGLGPEARKAAPVVFDRLVLRETLETAPGPAREVGRLSYHRDPAGAARAAGEEGTAFLLPPLTVERVWRLADVGGRLPPKSTYFWPKLPSGLLYRRL